MKRKILPVLLCFVFLISAFSVVGASAAEAAQDGIEASLSFAKTEYAIGENIDATLTVKNTGSSDIDISTEIVLPDGVSLVSGSLKQSVFTLAAGADNTSNITVAKGTATGSAPTGDGDTIMWIALMLVSATAFIAFAIKNRWISAKGFMSLLICVVMLGTAVVPMTVSAESNQFTVEETVKIDGESNTIKAIVTYGAPGEVGGVSEEIIGDGTAGNPYLEFPEEDMTLTTVSVPAGGSVHYGIYRVGGMYLTINDANAYVVSGGVRYDAVNGKVTFKVENALASDAVSFEIGNNGTSATSFMITFTNVTGSYANPTPVSSLSGDISISLEAETETGYYYRYYAEKTGTIRFYMTASVDSVMLVTNNRNSAQRSSEDEDAAANGYIELEVNEGDEIIINVGAKPNKRGKYPATDITWNGQYN